MISEIVIKAEISRIPYEEIKNSTPFKDKKRVINYAELKVYLDTEALSLLRIVPCENRCHRELNISEIERLVDNDVYGEKAILGRNESFKHIYGATLNSYSVVKTSRRLWDETPDYIKNPDKVKEKTIKEEIDGMATSEVRSEVDSLVKS